MKRSGESNGDGGDQYTGLDRFGRVVDQRSLVASSGTAVDRYGYTYDRNGNRLTKGNGVNTAFNETYTYDGLNQLTGFDRGSGTRTQSWNYDALGNWLGVTTNGTTQTRTASKQNEVTSISGATTPTYDANGNMTGDETGKTLVYDAWNKLVAVKNGSTTLVSYQYDGAGRRVVENAGSARDLYYSSQWQVLEERVGSTVKASYVWSPVYVDAMVARDRPDVGDRLYAIQDANFNVTALVNKSGVVMERYVYDAYGAATVLDASWAVQSGGSNYVWVYLHQGGRYDGVSGLYAFRNRDYSPTLGRWVTMDPMGYDAGDVNLYAAISSSPVNALDPNGLWLARWIVRRFMWPQPLGPIQVPVGWLPVPFIRPGAMWNLNGRWANLPGFALAMVGGMFAVPGPPPLGPNGAPLPVPSSHWDFGVTLGPGVGGVSLGVKWDNSPFPWPPGPFAALPRLHPYVGVGLSAGFHVHRIDGPVNPGWNAKLGMIGLVAEAPVSVWPPRVLANPQFGFGANVRALLGFSLDLNYVW